ncbi:MAG: acetyltransferase [Planctomycetota bacterium]|nr:acetyltransferase [Planctomycetota bacterium]
MADELSIKPGGIVVVGAGGHARVIVSTIRACRDKVSAVFDDDPRLWGKQMMGITIQGPVDRLTGYPGRAIIGIGDACLRKSVVDRLQLRWATIIHPHSFVDPAVPLGEGTVIFAGGIVQPEANIGNHVIINTGATVDHNCIVGDFSQIAPNATLCGNVSVELGAFIGAGAVVLENLSIGPWAIIGAGATVIRSLPSFVTAVGCPAQVIKIRTPINS